MATPILTAIEQGIKDTIKAYYDVHGHNVRQIKSYGGDFDMQNPDEFAQVVSRDCKNFCVNLKIEPN